MRSSTPWVRIATAGLALLSTFSPGILAATAATRVTFTDITATAGFDQPLVAHFGLGRHDGEVEIAIRWPCGGTQQLRAKPDQLLTITEPAAR